ncbi:MAG TPA: carboxypeptidase-like regulatory domain-containing protein [Chryseosolibacter sp.]
MNRRLSPIFTLVVVLSLLFSCSKDDPRPTTGKLRGQVGDALTASALKDVKVIVFNADDNAPTEHSLITDTNGNFEINLPPGNYFLKFYKQGYQAVPSPGMDAVPFSIEVGGTNDQSTQMLPSENMNTGFISGVVGTPAGVGGALVVAEDLANNRAFSSVSSHDGRYTIYNVPVGSYKVKAYLKGYSSNGVDASATLNGETTNVTIALSASASGQLSGTIRNLATGNKDVDISLVHPLTRETIPGLSTQSSNLAYTIANIPDGSYIARATFKNDERVMDPDRIAKFGEPVVTFNGNNWLQLTFDITGSITIGSPTNEATTTKPIDASSTTPTFSWTAYSSTSDYVIEVTDASTGAVVWGGFDRSGSLPVKNIVIPSSQRSIQFNADGSAAITSLIPGRVYRWRVFASKNDQGSATGWVLISASEDQRGLFKVAE